MRIDHIAYRVADRKKTSQFFIDAFGYRVQNEFEIKFNDRSKAQCVALEPPEKPDLGDQVVPWTWVCKVFAEYIDYHLSPELFISDGSTNSVVGKWVEARNGIGGIHHIAYQVEDVASKMREWQEKGYAEFTTENPIECPELKQCFTKPSELTGVIYEFISRGKQGFCQDSVKNLMESTKDLT